MREHYGAMDADSIGRIAYDGFPGKVPRQPGQPLIEPHETRPSVVKVIDRHRREQQTLAMIHCRVSRTPECVDATQAVAGLVERVGENGLKVGRCLLRARLSLGHRWYRINRAVRWDEWRIWAGTLLSHRRWFRDTVRRSGLRSTALRRKCPPRSACHLRPSVPPAFP